ncbi:hypothetical protein [Streptosporangium sp. KLBMP 9127]|nr:hypothetical protein [Streptosporangium sp. KLBMP 9127]
MGRTFLAVVVMATTAFNAGGATANSDAQAPATTVDVPGVAAAPTTAGKAEDACVRLRGAAACVGPDDADRPGITIEDTETDRLHPAVEYYLNGYLGTKYVIHNLAREGEVRGTRAIGKTVTFRAAIFQGNHRIKVSAWMTVRNVTKHPVKRETRVTPFTARARAEICTSTRGAASLCFAERKTFVFACDTSADRHQARAEYFVGGDPSARFEIHQLAGPNSCGKAEHGGLSISKYRASVFDHNNRVGDRLYQYN